MIKLSRLLYSFSLIIALTIVLLLSGCSSHHAGGYSSHDGPPNYYVDASKVPDAVPQKVARSKSGNPSSYVVFGKRYYVMKSSKGYHERGIASWYGTQFHAKRTSSGEPYSMLTMTAAHKTLPLPTYAQVTNLKNGKHIVVKINDRGPFHENRIIDLSYVAAKKLGITATGTGLVEVVALDGSQPNYSAPPVYAKSKNAKIYLQLGAFSQLANAQQLSQRIQPMTKSPVVIKSAYKNDAHIYRVQIGPLADVDNTDYLHHRLRTAGLGDSVTVIE